MQEVVLVGSTILGNVVEDVDLLQTLVEKLLVIFDALDAYLSVGLAVGALVSKP